MFILYWISLPADGDYDDYALGGERKHLYTLMQLDNSKHRSRAISRLFEGRKTHVLSCSIDYSHPLSPYSCSPRNA